VEEFWIETAPQSVEVRTVVEMAVELVEWRWRSGWETEHIIHGTDERGSAHVPFLWDDDRDDLDELLERLYEAGAFDREAVLAVILAAATRCEAVWRDM
jgi:hypothetical protein